MNITRQFPKSNIQIQNTLTKIKLKNDSVIPANSILKAADIILLNLLEPEYKAKMGLVGSTLAYENDAVVSSLNQQIKVKMFTSHFYQVLDFGIERGFFPASSRSFYNLPIDNLNLPDLVSEDQIRTWAERVISGEATRVAGGGVAMGFPSAAQVDAVYAPWLPLITTKSAKKELRDAAQEAIAALNPQALALIKRLWNQIEFAFSDDEISSRRRKAREWGVFYITRGTPSSYTGPLAFPETKFLYKIDVANDQEILLRNPGIAKLLYCFKSSQDAIPCMGGDSVITDQEIAIQVADLPAGNIYVFVTNMGPGPGQYEIEIN